jgi:tRNA-specific 2-thiouridylase
MNTHGKAIGLVSGGLDSALAVAVIRRQGIEVLGLNYHNGFSPGAVRLEVLGEESIEILLERRARDLSLSLHVPVEVIDISEEYIDLLLDPKYGYGANVNPCIDCRIQMLKRAKERMVAEGASFVFTGEVLGQRPMSQHRGAMNTVIRESGLDGYLVRPLSAKLLPRTVPETDGLLDRERLLDIQGRSRRRQMELAEEFGLTGYSQPAGGCLLTDENYARKFKDLVDHEGKRAITRQTAVLLTVGRHFRLSGGVKIVVGRERTENHYIERNWADDWLATTADSPGPTTLIIGDPADAELQAAASITARYSDAKRESSVRVRLKKGLEERMVSVAPAANEDLDRYRI